MLDLILKGGIINIILSFAYFFVVVISIERIIYFFIARGKYSEFKKTLETQLTSLNTKAIFTEGPLLKFKQTPFFALAKTYIENLKKSPAEQKERVQQTGDSLAADMGSILWTLSLIGHLSPLMGLLGTMTGLIRSFKGIEALGGNVDISVLAGGIWEAMLTTVMGLIVAIIAFLFYRIFDQHIEKKTGQLGHLVAELNIRYGRSLEEKISVVNSKKIGGMDDEIS